MVLTRPNDVLRTILQKYMRYELWATPDRTSLTFIETKTIEQYRGQNVVEPEAELVWSVDADTYNEFSKAHLECMVWEPHKPMDE